MKKLYLWLLLTLSLQAKTIQEVIEYSLNNNYQVQILQEELSIIEVQKSIEGSWNDPILKMGINDIQLNKPLKRDIEAMQNQFISISQTIPLSNRLKIAIDIENEKKKFIEKKIEIVKTDVVFGIRKAFIKANSARDSLVILNSYITFLERPMELIINLSSLEKDSVEKYIKTELLQKKYQLQREKWLAQIEIAKENIELIGNLKIDNFSSKINLKNYNTEPIDRLLIELDSKNPKLKMVSILKDIAEIKIQLAKAKEQADITLTGGIYQRFNRDDYFSLSVAYPLFINKKQSNRKVQEIKRANIQNISYMQTKVQLQQKLKIELVTLKSLYEELELLKQTSQKIDKLIDNAKSQLQNGGSLLDYYELFTKRVESKLSIEKKKMEIKLSENKVDRLLGVTQ